MTKSIFLSLIILSTSAFAGNFRYTAKHYSDSNLPGKKLVVLSNITYKGAPILTLSPEDSYVNQTLWAARAIGFKSMDNFLIDSTSRSLGYANTFSKNYELICREMGFKQNTGGGGMPIKNEKIYLPSKFASVQNGRINVVNVPVENPMGEELSIIYSLVCQVR